MKAPIAELFESCQGEGRFIGHPVIFIRFWGCNLRCQFNGKSCDTPYAVIQEKEKAKEYNPDELVDQIKSLGPHRLVWTGGEPLIYQNYMVEVCKLLGNDYKHEIETNGTLSPITELQFYMDWFNVSVKLKSSNQEEGYENKRINPKALLTFPQERSCLKFVINGEEDINEIQELIKQTHFENIYLMPQGATRIEILENSAKVVDLCMRYNYIFSSRLHILIWDSKRGV